MGNSEEGTDPQKVAEYHAYAGISAARTAIDAAASWLKMVLKLNFPSGNRVDLSKKEFRSEVAKAQAEIGEYFKLWVASERRLMTTDSGLNIVKDWRL